MCCEAENYAKLCNIFDNRARNAALFFVEAALDEMDDKSTSMKHPRLYR